MAAHKHQYLHELLKQDQEPFQLKTYISEKRSKLSQSTTLQINKPKQLLIPNTSTKRNNLCKNACFFSFHNSPDVTKSPFVTFSSPANKSPCKSPNGAVFNIPSKTAAILVEAAMRIQRQQQSKSKSQSKNAAFGLFGSFLKRLKDRSKSKKRAIGNHDIKLKLEEKSEESVEMSCSCSNRRLSSADLTESVEDKLSYLESFTTTSSDFGLMETRYCLSPFSFSLHKSASTSGSRTPDFCSPAASPSRHVILDKQICESGNLNNVQAKEEEEKEQCSPISVLDPPFEEDEENESRDGDEDDYDHECSYANVQRAKQQLLNRLRRFERLAELDPMELDEYIGESEESNIGDEPFVPETFNQYNSSKMSNDMKRLVSDLIIEEKCEEMICSGDKEVVLGRVWNRLDSWKKVEFDTIDMMIGLDFTRGVDGWKKFPDQVEDIAAEMEIEIYGVLMEELSEEMYNMD